jgi:hypothetical protein
MTQKPGALPTDTEAIAAWLTEPGVENIEAIRVWYGDSAVMRILEKLVDCPEDARASRFFKLVKADKRARKDADLWPLGDYPTRPRTVSSAPLVASPYRFDDTFPAIEGLLPLGPQAPAAPEVPDPFRPPTVSPRQAERSAPSISNSGRCDAAERVLGYAFCDRALLLRALTHSSYAVVHNEPLAWLGDRVYGAWTAHRLYPAAPEVGIGALTKAAVYLCRAETQASAYFEHGLHDLLALGGSVLGSEGMITVPMAATGLEALVCAMELDGGTHAAEAALDRMMEPPVRYVLDALASFGR